MSSCKAYTALGLAIIFCVSLAACGGHKPFVEGGPVIAELTLPDGAVNAPYSTRLHVSRGTGTAPFTWSIVSGNLPVGLSLDSISGTISGTPTTIGRVGFSVQVTDAKSLTMTRDLSIDIRGAVSVTPVTLPGGTVGIPYTASLTATGGVLPYTWSVVSGTLPDGLTLTTNPDSTATISGTPTILGLSTFTVQVADSETPPATGISSQSIAIEGVVTITTTSLPNGNVAIFYDVQLMATGGKTPYTWNLTAASGPLPPGLSLTSSTGVISGTPTTTGMYPIEVQVTDSESTPATAIADFTITIDPTPPLQVTTSSLPDGTQGVRYSSSLAATGGVPPYSWSLTAGSLPAGLTLSGTGVISGTPTGSTGSFPITVQVTDTLGNTASSSGLTLTINSGHLTITTVSLPAGTVSVPYSATLGAAGGTPPYTWSLRLGALPSGLTLNSSTGLISGTPTTSGGSSIQVQVQDSASPPATFVSPPFAITINPALTDAALTGEYTFSFSGYRSGTPILIAGRFTADGSGTISNGLLDGNLAGSTPATDVAFTGTYSITADGLGSMTFNPVQGSTLVFAVAVTSNGSGKLIQSDPSHPQDYGSGAIKTQTISALAAGNFAFGSTGVDLALNRFASAGAFQTNASGTLTKGTIDIDDGGTVTPAAFLTGSYSAPDPSTGRGTASLRVNSGQAQNFSYYLVSPSEMIQLSIDQVSGTSPLTLTSVLRGSTAGVNFTNLALKGASVLQTNGVNPNGGSPEAIGIAGLFNGDGTIDGNGFGNAALLFDQNTGGSLAQQQVAGGQYKVDPKNGRVTLNGFGGTPPVLYLVGQNQAFLVGTDGNATSGVLAPQTAGTTGIPLTNVSVLGAYVGGSVTPALPAVTNQVDWLFADGNGSINVSQDSSGPGGPQSNQFAVTYQVDATGRALVNLNPGGTLQGIMYVLSSTKVVILSTDANPVLSTFVIGKSAN
jgi:Putative Ig domain